MGNEKRHLIILLTLVVCLLGIIGKTHAQYPGAPILNTAGSADYTSVATVINAWRTHWSTPNDAYTWRADIINEVEKTLVAAGKATITDEEYDRLAEGLYFWLHQTVIRGTEAGDFRGGWYIGGIGIPDYVFGLWPDGNGGALGDFNGSQCVWELTEDLVPIGGDGINGYGPMLGSNTRMVIFTNKAESTILRAHSRCNVMFSTNGVNSKLLILGTKNH